jgi:hypothetical protein
VSFTAFGAIWKATATLLPPALDSKPAWAVLYAIARQESRLDARRQIGGPARGFWQFELGGIRGVLNHRASGPLIRSVLDRLDYNYAPETSYNAVDDNDVLAFSFARCLLWSDPRPLPGQHESETGWEIYLDCWRPGAPRYATWAAFYKQAWEVALA